MDVALGQKRTQHISFDDNLGPGNAGTYNATDSFGVDLYLTFNGYNSFGLSLWFETTANAASNIFLTGFTYGTTFDKPIQSVSFPLGFTVLQSTGLYATPNPSDLGSGTSVVDPDHVVGPGTYFIGRLSVDLSGLAPGVYTLRTDATNPHASEVTSYDGTTFEDNNLPVATYTITVVPEPSTLALLILTVIGIGAFTCRRAVSKGSYS
jgi:hypothetical protein